MDLADPGKVRSQDYSNVYLVLFIWSKQELPSALLFKCPQCYTTMYYVHCMDNGSSVRSSAFHRTNNSNTIHEIHVGHMFFIVLKILLKVTILKILKKFLKKGTLTSPFQSFIFSFILSKGGPINRLFWIIVFRLQNSKMAFIVISGSNILVFEEICSKKIKFWFA